MHNYVVLLSDLSYQLNLIGIAEYAERRQIADWLSGGSAGALDPRDPMVGGACEVRGDEQSHRQSLGRGQPPGLNSSLDEEDESWPQFLAFDTWMFTLGDVDCYPSVPHGHLHRKTNEWPKLNPYTGRAFSDVHLEDVTRRLSRAEMETLWSNDAFVEHCRKQVLWYSDFAPMYSFPKARRGKLHFPRW
jgi:hypothetical protein